MATLSNVRAAVFAAVCVLGLGGCGGSTRGPGTLRFHNADPVKLVNDRKPIAMPDKVDPGLMEYWVREIVVEPTRRALTVTSHRLAENINSLGDVPDSAWFTNRAPMTPEEIRKGPGSGGPDRSKPWRVTGVKVGGAAFGITIKDGLDDKYVIKFDERGFPETESSADVIVQRLTWAFGYNVPDNQVIDFKREELVLDPKAAIKDIAGNETPMTDADLDKYLGFGEHTNGVYRVLASRYIDGKPLGGIDPEGVREDDPNDKVPHELRRDLRGQRLLWAWVNHVDLKSKNSHASYGDGKYVKWWWLDFGESLGVGARTTGVTRLGFRSGFSFKHFMLSLTTFGLYVHPWEKQEIPDYRGLGVFDAESFDPADWATAFSWRPAEIADRFDEFWGAEILMRFTPAHVAAAVAAGRYTDQRTTDYMVKTLIERQRRIGRSAFRSVAPLTRFEAREQAGSIEICFDDLWLQHGYGVPTTTRYRATSFDHAGRVLGVRGAWVLTSNARTCVSQIQPGSTHDGYTIAELEVRRGSGHLPTVLVHVARGPQGLRVIGVDRR